MKRVLQIRTLLIALLILKLPAFVQAQANCSNATQLTPSATCSNVTGNLQSAGPDATAPAGACGGATAATTNDVWFRFTATSARHTISVSLPGTTYLTTGTTYIEAFQGTCGSLNSLACQTIANALNLTGLSVGTQYYIRVYVTGSTTSGSATNRRTFSICVTQPPAADNCSGATSLTSATSCSNISGNLALYTASDPAIAASCSNTPGADVWYSFVANSRFPTISLSSIASNLRAAGVSIQLFSGTCGSLASLACTSGTGTSLSLNLFNTHGLQTLTLGQTYYIRIYTPTAFPSGTNWTFNICVTNPNPGVAGVDYSKSYVNISKNANGGTVDPGDVLEIRTTFVVSSNMVDSLSFADTLFNTKGFKLVPGSLAIRTNEGKVYQSFTDAYDADPGWSYTSGLDTIVKMNFGIAASNVARGRLSNTSRPSVFGSTCILMVTYRVTVYAPYNTKINFKTGALTYRDVSSGVLRSINFAPNTLIVYQSPGLCPNAVSPSNALGAEFNGTFGAPSGATPLARNRGTSSYTTYTYAAFGPGGPGDYYYGIANNTSATYTTINTWNKPDANGYRVFSQWDITGDHTGASNPLAGNPACNVNQPISPSNPCGYMLIVNSAYRTDTAFSYTITNLCPNTYYELSAWFKNICYKCGADSTGTGASGANYIPSAPNDSSGVQPNIAFDVNGTDYFTTGNIQYTGTTPTGSDATNQWVKRGFTYLTGPAETSFTLTLRNNAPGGGGNDWALDDIAVATCSPNLDFTPTATPTFCNNNVVDVGGTVTSYFNNYTHYKWEKSVDDGASWVSTGITGTKTPVVNGNGDYEYEVDYPQFVANASDDGTQYRLLVATSAANLNNSCSIAGNTELTLNIDPCTPTLGTNFISFTAKVENHLSVLRWTTSAEAEKLQFIIERSLDGRSFSAVAAIQSKEIYSNALNTYQWTETFTPGTFYYRIKMTGTQNGEKYTHIVTLKPAPEAAILSVINPFRSELVADVQLGASGPARLQLIDNTGNIAYSQMLSLQAGANRVVIRNVGRLPSGLYTLQLITEANSINKKLIKQ